jgi:GNAT superfamily N-acetyltransferase
MGADLATVRTGSPDVVESPRRLNKELSYGYVHALWWVRLADGRTVVSVPPGAGDAVQEIVGEVASLDALADPELPDRLAPPVNEALEEAGLVPIDRTIHGLSFACNDRCVRRHHHGDCRPLSDESIPPAEGLSLPTHCFPDGIVYAVVVDGEAVSIAYAHQSHLMADRIADVGIETAPSHRRRGYAKTMVSAVTAHVTGTGGEALYGTRPDNGASIATARSVGYVPYARKLILSTPGPDVDHLPPPQK